MVGFAVLALFYLILMVCKLRGISETHRIKADQPTLRNGKLYWVTSNRTGRYFLSFDIHLGFDLCHPTSFYLHIWTILGVVVDSRSEKYTYPGLYNLFFMIKFILKLWYLDIGEVLDFIGIFKNPRKRDLKNMASRMYVHLLSGHLQTKVEWDEHRENNGISGSGNLCWMVN